MPPFSEPANCKMEQLDKQLLIAAKEGDLPTVKAILYQTKAYLNCINEHGQTPLYLAARYHHLAVVHEFIKSGADLNIPDKTGKTPLHASMSLDLCMETENLQVVKLLVSHGADLGKADAEGLTPIHQASRTGRVHILQWLLDQNPYGYLPDKSIYPPRASAHALVSTQGTHAQGINSFAWLLTWFYPAAEVTASIVCCLPVWQSCTTQDDDYVRIR